MRSADSRACLGAAACDSLRLLTLLGAVRLIAAPQELGASQELQDKFIRMLRDKGFFQACRRVTVGAHITRWHLCLHAYVHKVGSSLSQWRTS